MFEPAIDPVHWSTKAIISLGDEVIHELAKRASATVNAYKLTVGRCLLAVERSKLHQRMGYSGAIHYAIVVLGLGKKRACELRRVARELEELPKLSKSAELGQVGWGKLRVIVSKATLETEDFWLRIASLRTCDEIEKLAASTERGKLPWESLEAPEPLTRFQFHLGAVAGELFERVIQAVSQENEKPMSAGEVIEHLAIERLAKRPLTPEFIEATRKEARRGSAAAKHRHVRLIEEARQLVQECGLREQDSTDPLAVALGAGTLNADEGGSLYVARELSKKAPLEILEIGMDAGGDLDKPVTVRMPQLATVAVMRALRRVSVALRRVSLSERKTRRRRLNDFGQGELRSARIAFATSRLAWLLPRTRIPAWVGGQPWRLARRFCLCRYQMASGIARLRIAAQQSNPGGGTKVRPPSRSPMVPGGTKVRPSLHSPMVPGGTKVRPPSRSLMVPDGTKVRPPSRISTNL